MIILRSHTAELQCITAEYVRLGSYRHLSIIFCRSLYQDSQSEEAISSIAICAPAIVAMDPNGSWSPIPVHAQKQVNKMSREYDGGVYSETLNEDQIAQWLAENEDLPAMMLEMVQIHASDDVCARRRY